jgi:hypothetical protein
MNEITKLVREWLLLQPDKPRFTITCQQLTALVRELEKHDACREALRLLYDQQHWPLTTRTKEWQAAMERAAEVLGDKS